MAEITIAPLTDLPRIQRGLSVLLVETVASGGSVSFMHPLPLESARAFWRSMATTWSQRSRCCWTSRRTNRIAPKSRR